MQFEREYDPWGRMYGGEQQSAPGPQAPAQPPAIPAVPTAPAQPEYVEPFDYQSPAYQGSSRPTYNLPNVPRFNAPQFEAPDLAGVLADPSYTFRRDQGLGALQNAAAAKGTLRTGGALKGLVDYAGSSASQEYANIYSRALQKYGTEYQGAKDSFAPGLQDYQNKFGLAQDQGNLAFAHEMDLYKTQLYDELAREQMLAQMGLPQ